ncbi:unnamed protein product [Brassica oleracea]
MVKAQQYHHPISLCQKGFSLLCHVSDLSVGKKLQLRVPGHIYAALEVQSLVGVLDSCAGTLRCHSDDTVDLFTYSATSLTSNVLSSGTSSWSYLRKGTSLSQTSSRST